MITIFLFGIVTVFFVFLILYLFSVVLKFFSGKERPAVVEEKKTRYSGENEELIAVISAVLSQVIEGEYRIVSVKKSREKRGYEAWKKTGWRRRRWSESSEWW
ncbi:MAG: Uncharacterized protein XD64_0016 [Thermotoga sp. 47_83]|jgi:Na+-transporting methylmalonyl-CoA/oxaloacetate decarboxylase gamma subunit|uniref:Sodium pump decarboxylase, gamma subunit n=1 Tax=Thermotoga petrophila TaxID=93929 RepID=A0A117L348_9THEM|nr:MAG: Uncharacterized protein XD57_0017 [Thermotoga petrophila]KUK34131.1 MAG: Uncharacterized protein XD64_0016 [Thermotoga sp. 47_83]MBZ4661430.1 hypothetical protein [Thermotoga sp.]MDK2893392.1 glutaconyl-CoA/methylmalonyl-CoA decarboxylase subunit delta [Thermotoga sp.]MDK2897822.1 glutaconyl-CoA/methylmalonyl-CoA decarboxylase subunit delta [Thermotoga sp.]